MRMKTVHLTVSGVALALLFTPGSLSAARPDFLRTEGCENPVGVDVTSPRFSWRLPGGTIELTVTVPAGVTAEIRLPGRSPSKQGPGTETYVLSAARERTCFDSRKEK